MPRDTAGALTWANSAAAGTVQTLVGSAGAHDAAGGLVLIHNPSASALTVSCRVRWTDAGGTNRDAELLSFTVAAGTNAARFVEGLGLGIPVLAVSNNTALSTTGGFTAQARVEFVGDY